MIRTDLMRLSLVLFSLVSPVPASGQTTQRPARVEVVVPKPPVPVMADGKRVLVYEVVLRTRGTGRRFRVAREPRVFPLGQS